MGLDMYLYVGERHGDVSALDMAEMDSYFWDMEYYRKNPEAYKDCGKPQLDIEVDKETLDFYENQYNNGGILREAGYWRKANHIHNWFVEHVQNGVDDCGVYPVDEDDLCDLQEVCEFVLEKRNNRTSANFLPTQCGFFFGSTDYDEYYYEDVKDTIDIINKILDTVDFDKEVVCYQSSW